MAYISRHDWDLAQQAINITASSEASSRYGGANLINPDPAIPWIADDVTGDAVLEFAAPVAPAYAMLAYQYLDAGLTNVKIQGNASDSWGAPSFSATFTIPAKRLDGPTNQKWTRNPILPLSGVGAGYAFWRLVCEDANSQDLRIGRLLLYSQLLRVTLFHVDGSPFDHSDATHDITNMTELDLEAGIYRLGGPRRRLMGYLVGTDLSAGTAPIQLASDFQDLHEANEGRLYPFAFLPFENFADAWLVRPEAFDLPRAHRQDGAQVFPFAVREVARGLPFP